MKIRYNCIDSFWYGVYTAVMFRPLLRVTDKLLAIGLLTDKDLDQLLCLIDPANFDNGYFPGMKFMIVWTVMQQRILYDRERHFSNVL